MTSPDHYRAFGALLLGAVAWVGPLAAAPELFDASEDELLLLQVRIERQYLPDIVPAYRTPAGVLLPIGELSRILELAIEVDLERGTAEGFVLRREQALRFDAVARTGTLGGQPIVLAPAEIEIHRDDLYVALEVLTQWLPVDLVVDERASTLQLLPREPLPRQLREARERRARMLGAGSGSGRPDLPRFDPPRTFLRAPAVDLNLRATGGSDVDGSLQYSLLAGGDLLWLDSTLFVSGTQAGFGDETRFTLGRRDPSGGLLGPLRATEAVLGDVYHPGVDLVSQGRSGRGFLLGNIPLDRAAHLDRHALRGELPAGWAVELYRDGALLAFEASRDDGLYELLDLPLQLGTNRFELVFYGPHGEQRREIHVVEMGGSLVPAGELQYRLGGNDPRFAGPRAQLELGYGLTPRLSTAAALSRVESPDGEARDFATVGLRGSWQRLFATLDAVASGDGGHALQVSAQTRIGAVGLVLQHAELMAFESETFLPLLGPVARRSVVRIDGNVPGPGGGSLPVSLLVRRDGFVAGGSITEASLRLSAFRGGLFASNQLSWSVLERDGRTDHRATGRVLLRRFGQRLSWRGEAGYELQPDAELVDLAFRVERRLGDGLFLAGGARHGVRTESTLFLAELAKRQGAFGYGITFDWSEAGGARVSATLSAGLSPVPDSHRWHSDAQPQAPMGSVIARAFLDTNGNGIWDPGEVAVEGVGFTVNGGQSGDLTGEDGRALLARLPSYREVDLAVATRTLEDPLWVPASEGVRMVPRPGKGAVIDFPILATGEIDGTLFVREGTARWEASGVRLQLVDEQGEVAQETRTAYDGYYTLARISPGTYTLRVDPEQAERLGMVGDLGRPVVVEHGGGIFDGVDLVVERRERPRTDLPGESEGTPVVEIPVLAVHGEPPPLPFASGRALGAPPTGHSTGATVHGVQLGSYRHAEGAAREARRLAGELGLPGAVVRADIAGSGTWHRVVAGALADTAAAQALRLRLEADGVEVGPVRQYRRGQEGSAQEEVLVATAATPRELPSADTLARDPEATGGMYWLQVASLRRAAPAAGLARSVEELLGRVARVVEVDLDELGSWHRVLVGPFATAGEARRFGDRIPPRTGIESGPIHHLPARTPGLESSTARQVPRAP